LWHAPWPGIIRRAIPLALATIDVNPEFPPDLQAYLQEQAEILLKEKKIPGIPNWSKALRPDAPAPRRSVFRAPSPPSS
jgi:hypothetical protein